MATPKKKFDAVLASRDWKETVARKTAGMSAGVKVLLSRANGPALRIRG